MTTPSRSDLLHQRLTQFQKNLTADAVVLLANPNDIQYLSGFISLVPEEREGLLLVSANQATLLHAAFSPVEKLNHLAYLPGVYPQKISQHILHLLETGFIKTSATLFVDETYLRVSELRAVESALAQTEVALKPANLTHLQEMRVHKDSYELVQLREAATCAGRAWQTLEPEIKPGMTEQQVKIRLEQLLLEYGSQRPAFPTIVAFGAHAALPHHQPTEMVLEDNTAVLIDFGATVHEYRSDMTRTLWIGDTPNETFLEIEQLVKAGYQAAIATTQEALTKPDSDSEQQPSVEAKAIDTAARSIIKEAGYGKEFIHTTGHGLGLDIHESPSLNWTNAQQLRAGAVITIEPGIYLEGQFGYRYENTVVLTESGVDEITLLEGE